jgi:SAM-dependent methyltransferase
VGGLARRLWPLVRRAYEAGDRAVFPEAAAAPQQWQRLVMNGVVDAHIESLDPATRSACEISGDLHADRPWREYAGLAYPEFDLCAPLQVGRRFDVVICEQVIEHVEQPWTAAANLRGLCEPGGRLIVSTPFLIKIHEHFGMRDYWRFSPRGLRTLLESAGLEVEEVGAWGNRECVIGNLNRWSLYRRSLHSLANEPDLPVQVWAFARNPE